MISGKSLSIREGIFVEVLLLPYRPNSLSDEAKSAASESLCLPRAGEVLTSSKGSAADFRTPTPTFQHFLSFILFLDIKTKSPGLHGIHKQWPP